MSRIFAMIAVGLVSSTVPAAQPRAKRPKAQGSAMSARPPRARSKLYSLTQKNYRRHRPFAQRIDMNHIDYPRLQAAIFHVTNAARIKHGRAPVRYHHLLELAARGHAQRMVNKSFYSHQDLTSVAHNTAEMRAKRAGVTNAKIAENLYKFHALDYGGGSVFPLPGRGKFSRTHQGPALPMHTYLSFADAVVAGWLDSPGHRKNLLNKSALELGVGAQFYWNGDWPYFMAVQNFQFFQPAQSKR